MNKIFITHYQNEYIAFFCLAIQTFSYTLYNAGVNRLFFVCKVAIQRLNFKLRIGHSLPQTIMKWRLRTKQNSMLNIG